MGYPVVAEPFVRWVGGKRGLAREILAGIEFFWGPDVLSDATYHEPFLGGGAVFFALRTRHGLGFRACLSDRNPEIANLYREVRDRPAEVAAIAEGWRVERATYERLCREFRGFGPRTATWSAARTLYLNRCAFNGLYRVGPNGFNVPFGDRPAHFPPVDRRALESATAALRGVQIADCDFRDAPPPRPGDLVYLDPPYALLSSHAGSFTDYDGGGFSFRDHERLHDHVVGLAEFGVRVVASNADTPWIRDLYSDTHLRFITARRSVGVWSDSSARRADEVLVFAGPGIVPGRSEGEFPTLAAKSDSGFVRLEPDAVRARLGLHSEVRVEWLAEFGRWAIYPHRRIPIAEVVFVGDDQLDDPEFVRRYRSRVLRTVL